MLQIEYKLETTPKIFGADELNLLGKGGWQLASVVSGANIYYYYFVKEKVGQVR